MKLPTDERIVQAARHQCRQVRHLRRRIADSVDGRVYFAGFWMRVEQAERVAALMEQEAWSGPAAD